MPLAPLHLPDLSYSFRVYPVSPVLVFHLPQRGRWCRSTQTIPLKRCRNPLSLPKAAPRTVRTLIQHVNLSTHGRASKIAVRRQHRKKTFTSPLRFCSFRRQPHGDRYVGLPSRHLPFTGFLTLSTNSSHRASWCSFTPLPPLGFHWPSELFPHSQS